MNKYKLIIKVCGNIDHGEDPNKAPYGMKEKYTETSNEIYELQVFLRDFIDENNLGAGNLVSAKVYEDDKYIGDIFYNGNYKSKEK